MRTRGEARGKTGILRGGLRCRDASAARLVMSASGCLSKRSVESMAALVAAAHRLLGLVREIGSGGGGVGGGRKAGGARPVCSIVRQAECF